MPSSDVSETARSRWVAPPHGRTVLRDSQINRHNLKFSPAHLAFTFAPVRCASAVAECCCTSRLWGCRLRAFSTSWCPPRSAMRVRLKSAATRQARGGEREHPRPTYTRNMHPYLRVPSWRSQRNLAPAHQCGFHATSWLAESPQCRPCARWQACCRLPVSATIRERCAYSTRKPAQHRPQLVPLTARFLRAPSPWYWTRPTPLWLRNAAITASTPWARAIRRLLSSGASQPQAGPTVSSQGCQASTVRQTR